MFSTRGVGDHRENSVSQRRHIVDLWHLAALMDKWGLDNMDKCSNHIVFSCETVMNVYQSYLNKNF